MITLSFLNRAFLATIFILSGMGKFAQWDATAQYMTAQGMPLVYFFLLAAGLLEITAGVLLLIGYRTRVAATVLTLFLIPVTLIFHDFWNLQGPERQMQMINFLKNLAIMGGLIGTVVHGAGRASVDWRREPERELSKFSKDRDTLRDAA